MAPRASVDNCAAGAGTTAASIIAAIEIPANFFNVTLRNSIPLRLLIRSPRVQIRISSRLLFPGAWCYCTDLLSLEPASLARRTLLLWPLQRVLESPLQDLGLLIELT